MFAYVRDDVLRDPNLTPTDKLVWAALMMRWMGKDNCWPTQQTVAEDIASTRSTVSTSIQRLIELQYVVTKRGRYGLLYGKGPAYVEGGNLDVGKANISEPRCRKSQPQMSEKPTSDVGNSNTEEYQEQQQEYKVPPVCPSTTSPRARVGRANGNSVTHKTATDSQPEQQAPVDAPHPDPVRPNDIDRLWYDELQLTSAPSYDRLQGGMRLTALNVHYSHTELEQAIRKIADTPALRSWAGRRGPAYLSEQHKGQLVIDTVQQWQSFDRNDMSDDDLRKMMDEKRQRIAKMIGAG